MIIFLDSLDSHKINKIYMYKHIIKNLKFFQITLQVEKIRDTFI